MGWDGVEGFSMVNVAREAIALALASQQFASAFFGNGTRFGGILTSDDPDLDEEQATQIREQIEALHAKADKAFRLLVLRSGFKFESVGVNPSEAQVKEIRDQQVTEIARFFNMPLHKLKLNTPGAVSYASVEMADLDYYKGCLLNWITLCEEEYNAKLIPSLEMGNQFFKHNANAFLRGTIKDRFDALGQAHDRGIINADDWREMEDMNPQPDGQGKVYLVQGEMIPKDQLIALTDARIESEKAKAKAKTAPVEAPAAPTAPASDSGSASARADAAEQLAREAQQAAVDEREKRLAAEASQTATASELEERRAADRTASQVSAQLTALAADLRALTRRHGPPVVIPTEPQALGADPADR
jgi:hypothetical protein